MPPILPQARASLGQPAACVAPRGVHSGRAYRSGMVYQASFRDRCGEAGLFGLLHGRGLCPWSRGSNSSPKRAPLHFTACRNWCESRQVVAAIGYYGHVSTYYCSAYCSYSCGQVGDVVWEPCKARVQGSQQKGESTIPYRGETRVIAGRTADPPPSLLTKVR